MGLRDRIAAALTGVPASTDTQRNRTRGDGHQHRGPRQGQTRARSNTSSTLAGRQASHLSIEGSSISLPEPRSRRQQLAIQEGPTSTSAGAPQQNKSTGSADLARGQLLRGRTVKGPALPPAKCLRPPEDDEGDDLPPFSEREIIDVTEEGDESSGEANARPSLLDSAAQNRRQQVIRPANPTRQASVPQKNEPLKRLPIFGNRDQDQGSARAGPPRRGAQLTIPRTHTAPQLGRGSRAGNSETVSTTRASGELSERPPALYLGTFDLEEAESSAQQPATSNNRARPSQRGRGNSRSGPLSQDGPSSRTSSTTRRTTVVTHGYHVGPPYWYRVPSRFDDYSYDWYTAWPGQDGRLPWPLRPYAPLHSQTVFSEISTDYFEQDAPAGPDLSIESGLEVINRYYNGWRDAYTQALSTSASGTDEISGADRTRIERNLENLPTRQNEAVSRLRSGDQSVLQETLDQIKMDRRMAVDMPVSQIRWAAPWIKEVWVAEHGEIPN